MPGSGHPDPTAGDDVTTDHRTVLVIGATGQQGGTAARALLARGWDVLAFVRDPGTPAARRLAAAGAGLVVGDLDDPVSVGAAMTGAYGVFLALPMMDGPLVTADGVAAERRRGCSAVEQADRAGVGHLVYSSVFGADSGTDISFYDSKAVIEARIREVGVPATVLRPVTFMETFTTLTRPAIVAGEVILPLALHPQTPCRRSRRATSGSSRRSRSRTRTGCAAPSWRSPGTCAPGRRRRPRSVVPRDCRAGSRGCRPRTCAPSTPRWPGCSRGSTPGPRRPSLPPCTTCTPT
ncbi:NmrA family NAD(P)-binding protein [Catellatospora coxensis]